MRRPFALLALIVAFSGTPLRLAEAADDLARSLAGPEDAGEVEMVDGGVGDDQGETIRADSAHGSVDAPTPCGWGSPAPSGLLALPLPPRPAAAPPRYPPASPPPRHAWLARFLC